MKVKQVYICEICGKESTDKSEILRCEAGHLGLTPEEKEKYDHLLQRVLSYERLVARRNNDCTRAALDGAVVELMAFEAVHWICH